MSFLRNVHYAALLLCLAAVPCVRLEILDELLSRHAPLSSVVQGTTNLTNERRIYLSQLNLHPASLSNLLDREIPKGIPDNVHCEHEIWCDALTCTEVCKRGTVALDPWFTHAMKFQIALSRTLPLCYAQWLGTHNSGITLADGYGNRDPYYTDLLKLTKTEQRTTFQTYNQWFSLTDQLNMGVRVIELDVHWVKDALRIAHCGGLSSLMLDIIASFVNSLASLIGSPFRWDSATIGCFPSASSIEADDQRLLTDAMQEISDWLNEDVNKDEFLMIYIDDQLDLAFWDLLPMLRHQLTQNIPLEQIFTPADMIWTYGLDNLPSAEMLLRTGRRVMFLSRRYYSDPATRLFFFYTHEGSICTWREPSIDAIDVVSCTIAPTRNTPRANTMTGQISRLTDCAIRYGPLSCSLNWGEQSDRFTDNTLVDAFRCGFNFPSPDRLTPRTALSAIWSWAPGHPKKQDMQNGSTAETMVVIAASDGRWRSKALSFQLPIVCRNNKGDLQFSWDLHLPSEPTILCKPEFFPDVPKHGKENAALQQLLLNRSIDEARLILSTESTTITNT